MSEFTEIVEEILGDLLSTHGFVCVDKVKDLAVFESTTCTLTVGHDSQRSSEIFMGLNRRDGTCEPEFNFVEVVLRSILRRIRGQCCQGSFGCSDYQLQGRQ